MSVLLPLLSLGNTNTAKPNVPSSHLLWARYARGKTGRMWSGGASYGKRGRNGHTGLQTTISSFLVILNHGLTQRTLVGKGLMELLVFLPWRFLKQQGFLGGRRENSLPLNRLWWDNLARSKALGLTGSSYRFWPLFLKIWGGKKAFSVPYKEKKKIGIIWVNAFQNMKY